MSAPKKYSYRTCLAIGILIFGVNNFAATTVMMGVNSENWTSKQEKYLTCGNFEYDYPVNTVTSLYVKLGEAGGFAEGFYAYKALKFLVVPYKKFLKFEGLKAELIKGENNGRWLSIRSKKFNLLFKFIKGRFELATDSEESLEMGFGLACGFEKSLDTYIGSCTSDSGVCKYINKRARLIKQIL